MNNDSIKINLTKKQIMIVSSEDSDLYSLKWSTNTVNGCYYAVRYEGYKRIYTHRLILERILGRSLVANELSDHINGDTLDNRRCNLRLATKKENCRNARRSKNSTSGYKGVSWNKAAKKWRAYIVADYKQIHLGLFENIEDAHNAYYEAAKKYHGDFARFE